jgi:diaminopimelate epimerase
MKAQTRPIPFVKMHGLGNDFVILDARGGPLPWSEAAARAIADRHLGIGCDQVILMAPASNGRADLRMRIRNSDGAEVEHCGNAARCVARILMRERGSDAVTIELDEGIVVARAAGDQVEIDMGSPRTDWREIPLARALDTLHLPLSLGPLADPVATSMGNPHATFFVAAVAAIDLAALGPKLEHDPLFPERANIGVAQILGPDEIRLRVWERGAGITLACGTGACAALVAAHRRGLVGRRARLRLDGGELLVEWRGDGHVVMTGPTAISFAGSFEPSLIAGAGA